VLSFEQENNVIPAKNSDNGMIFISLLLEYYV